MVLTMNIHLKSALILMVFTWGCHRSSLATRNVQNESHETMDQTQDVSDLDDSIMDMDITNSPDLQDMFELPTFENYKFHTKESSVYSCINESYGCFEDLRQEGLPLYAVLTTISNVPSDNPLLAELEELQKEGYFMGIDLAHSDETYHMFECGDYNNKLYYHTEDVYVSCQNHVLYYKYNTYTQDYSEEERTVGFSCGGGSSSGPFIRDPWFTYYKQSREAQGDNKKYVITYHVLIHSLDLKRSYKLGPFQVAYDFRVYQDICSNNANTKAVEPVLPLTIERLDLQ